MSMGLSLRLALGTSTAVGGGLPPPPLTSIDANGWQADYTGTPPSTILNTAFEATGCSGFDSNGNLISSRNIRRGLRVTRRIRNPGLSTLQAQKVGTSLVIPQGATVAGVTNNSTRVAPLPVANIVTRFNQVIGNGDRTVEVSCGHYYATQGEQVACVEVTMSDGTITLTQRTSTMVFSSDPDDKKPVAVYRVTFPAAQVATLANGQITYQCNVYPLIGTAASVARTSDSVTRGFPAWKFAPRYDVKDPSRLATPPVCYLDAATGNDTTGVWSTNDATAQASPFLTIGGALAAGKISAIPAGDVVPSGHVDGCIIYARAGSFALPTMATAVPAKGADLIITRAAGTSKAAAIVQQTVAARMRIGQTGLYAGMQGSVRFFDLTYQRTAAVNINGDAQRLNISFVSTAIDGGAINTAIGGATVDVWFWGGTTFTNMPSASGSALRAVSGGSVGIMRGCSGNIAGCAIFGYNVHGNDFTNAGSFGPNGLFVASNFTVTSNLLLSQSVPTMLYGADADVNGGLMMGNVMAYISTTSNPMRRMSGDAETGNMTHILDFANTFAGADIYGRDNDMYVDADAPAGSPIRVHQWCRQENNCLVQSNSKHDLFTPANAARIGGWERSFAAHNSNFIQFRDAGSGGFAPDYEGPNSTVGASNTVGLNPRFKNPQHVTLPGPVAGAGGGDYRPMRIAQGDAFDSPLLTGADDFFLPGYGPVIGAYA